MARGSNPSAVTQPAGSVPSAPANPMQAPRGMGTPASVFNPPQAMTGQPRMAAPTPMLPAASPAASNNVFQQAAGAQTQAMETLGGLMSFQPSGMRAAQLGPAATMSAVSLGPASTFDAVGRVADISAPGMIDVNQLATTDLSPYLNPYTSQVIEAGQADIERQRQMASRQMGARASAAGAFGGSRQAVQEGVLAGEALREAANLSAQQRQRGFETALQAGQFDIGQMQAARALSAQQQMQANSLNQQAAEAAAAREQAARMGNMQAANQFAMQQAQLEQQAQMANMAAENARMQAQAQLEQAANQAAFSGQFQAANVRAGAAGQLGGLGQQMFGQGQNIIGMQQDFGRQQQATNQALIDAARGQFAGFAGAPAVSIGLPLQAVGAANMGQRTQVTSQQPGLFGVLGALSGIGGGLL